MFLYPFLQPSTYLLAFTYFCQAVRASPASSNIPGDHVQAIAISPGGYQVVLYTYLHSMNGRVWLDQPTIQPEFPELSIWFRQDHPTRPIPTWIIAHYAYEDVPKQDAWYPLRDRIQSGQLAIAPEPKSWVSYLIHLIPFTSEMEVDQPNEMGWFDPTIGLRVPVRCPIGIATDSTEDPSMTLALDWIFEPS
jgi:hypothetical protein